MKPIRKRFFIAFRVFLILPALLILSSCNIGKRPFNLNADEIDEIEFGSNLGFFAPATYTKDDPEFYELIDLVNSFEYMAVSEPLRGIVAGGDRSVWFGEELNISIGYVRSQAEGWERDYTVIYSCYGKSYDGPDTLIAKDTEFCFAKG